MQHALSLCVLGLKLLKLCAYTSSSVKQNNYGTYLGGIKENLRLGLRPHPVKIYSPTATLFYILLPIILFFAVTIFVYQPRSVIECS